MRCEKCGARMLAVSVQSYVAWVQDAKLNEHTGMYDLYEAACPNPRCGNVEPLVPDAEAETRHLGPDQ